MDGKDAEKQATFIRMTDARLHRLEQGMMNYSKFAEDNRELMDYIIDSHKGISSRFDSISKEITQLRGVDNSLKLKIREFEEELREIEKTARSFAGIGKVMDNKPEHPPVPKTGKAVPQQKPTPVATPQTAVATEPETKPSAVKPEKKGKIYTREFLTDMPFGNLKKMARRRFGCKNPTGSREDYTRHIMKAQGTWKGDDE